MKKHLSALSVERIKPPKEGVLEIFDLGYPGLALRVGHGGAKSFCLFHRPNGKLEREFAWQMARNVSQQSTRCMGDGRESLSPTVHRLSPRKRLAHCCSSRRSRNGCGKDQSKNKANTVYQSG